jgi:DNA-binding NarL/FixJ family response regulator
MAHESTDASSANIYIVGPSLLHNQLLASYLEKQLKVECTCIADLTTEDIRKTASDRVRLFLLDCSNWKTAELSKTLEAGRTMGTGTFLAVLFNVGPAPGIEKLVRRYKIRGIFYQKDSREVLLKGLRTILRGDMWLSRRVLSECVLSSKETEATEQAETPLSDREKEVLKLVAMGLSNDEIAEKMYLSPHTVKTHLYHVYKKIGASNRMEAILWAASYLCQ